MGESKEPRRISTRELEWRKSPDFREKFADIMRVGAISDRGVYLEFGNFDYEKTTGTGELIDAHINFHTRLIVSYEHLKAIAKVLMNTVTKEEARRKGK